MKKNITQREYTKNNVFHHFCPLILFRITENAEPQFYARLFILLIDVNTFALTNIRTEISSCVEHKNCFSSPIFLLELGSSTMYLYLVHIVSQLIYKKLYIYP